MAKHAVMIPALLVGLLLTWWVGEQALYGQEEGKKVLWTHGLNFKVRKFGQLGFEDAKGFGAEGFQDKDLNKMVFVLETGAIGTGSAAKLPPSGRDPANPTFFHALELRAREPGQDKFDDKTPKFGMEVFKDVNTDNLLYITETGSLAVMPAGSLSAPDPEKVKKPVWFHGLEMKVRKAGEAEFDKAKKVSLEVFKDENTNQLVYVTSTGQIAIVPAGSASKPEEVKGPTWFHAFEVKVRKADEKEFSKETQMYGVEVYKDENAGTLIYLAQTGAIAVVPAGSASKPASSKAPEWLFGRSFRVRTYDQTDFNDKTPKFGAEVYKDVNTGNLVYMTDTGSFYVGAGK